MGVVNVVSLCRCIRETELRPPPQMVRAFESALEFLDTNVVSVIGVDKVEKVSLQEDAEFNLLGCSFLSLECLLVGEEFFEVAVVAQTEAFLAAACGCPLVVVDDDGFAEFGEDDESWAERDGGGHGWWLVEWLRGVGVCVSEICNLQSQ
jgi:hypothetical protein